MNRIIVKSYWFLCHVSIRTQGSSTWNRIKCSGQLLHRQSFARHGKRLPAHIAAANSATTTTCCAKDTEASRRKAHVWRILEAGLAAMAQRQRLSSTEMLSTLSRTRSSRTSSSLPAVSASPRRTASSKFAHVPTLSARAAPASTTSGPPTSMQLMLLRRAVEADSFEKAQTELDAGADVNGCGATGWTAVHSAAEKGNARMLSFLLANGAEHSPLTVRPSSARAADGHSAMLLPRFPLFGKERFRIQNNRPCVSV